jgi:hypothetical protein
MVFFAVNASLAVLGKNIQRYENQSLPWSPYKTRSWWSLKAFEAKKQHEIVLMGSSLMMDASDCADALAFESSASCCWAHPCNYLIAKIKELTGHTIDNFCFALPGQSAADAWCVAHTAFVDSRVPKVIIYGISPADFMNSSFLGPSHTEVFKLMHQVADCSDVEREDTHGRWNELNFALEHEFWLYRHRTDAGFFLRLMTDLILTAIFHADLTRSNLPVALRLQFSLTMPSEFFINDKMPNLLKFQNVREIINGKAVPLIDASGQVFKDASADDTPEKVVRNDSAHPPLVVTASNIDSLIALQPKPDLAIALNRYAGIFNYFSESSYSEQMLCLARLANYCQCHKIKLLLVNMPVTIEHLRLIPPQNYHRYFQDVSRIAASSGADFIDMYDPMVFPTKLFMDSNHLNNIGAVRFWDLLLPRIASKVTERIAARREDY